MALSPKGEGEYSLKEGEEVVRERVRERVSESERQSFGGGCGKLRGRCCVW